MEENEIQELWNDFVKLLRSTNRPNIDNLINWLDTTDFKYAPASSQYHNSFKGGLLDHSLNVYYALKDDFKALVEFMELPEDTVIITALLHDICKIDCYCESSRNVKDGTGNWITVPYYTFDELRPWGHGDKSVILIQQHGVTLSDVEISMIRNHMGFSVEEDSRRIGKLFRICPQCLPLHFADMEATYLLENYDGPQRFKDKLLNKVSITDSLKSSREPRKIKIDGQEYVLANPDAHVDGVDIIEVKAYNGQLIKVHSPYGDGLPF